MRGGEAIEHFDTVRMRRDGTLIDVSLTISPIRDAAGRSSGVQDRQRHHRAEAAEDELREADRRKNEFLAMLAHELRNPLAPIRNAVQILRLTGGSGESVSSGVRDDGASGRPDGPAGG